MANLFTSADTIDILIIINNFILADMQKWFIRHQTNLNIFKQLEQMILNIVTFANNNGFL